MRIEDAAKTLGKVIRARRELLNLTQEETAELAGCGDVFLYHLEQGKQTVRFDKLLAVCHTLGLELQVVTGNQGVVDGTDRR